MSETRAFLVGFACGLLACGLYTIALFLPVYVVPDGSWPGWVVLIVGWAGVILLAKGQIGVIAWFANPVFAVALGLLVGRLYRAAAIVGGIAVVLALPCFLVWQLVRDEAGNTQPVLGYGAGLFLWLAAVAIVPAAAIALRRLTNAGRRP